MEQYFPIILIALFAVVLFVLPARQRKRMQAQGAGDCRTPWPSAPRS